MIDDYDKINEYSVKETTDNNTKPDATIEEKSSKYASENISKKNIEKNIPLQDSKNAINSLLTLNSTKSVYVGSQMSIYGKLSADGVNISYQQIIVKVDGKQYNTTTTRYGNYKIKITPTTSGNKTIIAIFKGSKNYSSATASTTFQANKKSTLITLGRTKSVYVGGTVQIYGKLTANNKTLAKQTIDIYIDNEHYQVKTTRYGNYYYNYTSKTQGTHQITVKYNGTNKYTNSTNNKYFNAKKKTSLLTLGSTKNVYVGGTVQIYGKLTANNKNLAKQRVTIKVDGKQYNLTTSQYGNYNMNITATNEGYKTIIASYSGTNAITSDTNTTYFNAIKKTTNITIGSTKNVYINDKIHIYGKLTVNGNNLPYKTVKIKVDGITYTVTTTKYGNYDINITTSSIGNKTITATFNGDNYYLKSSSSTTSNVKKIVTKITLDPLETKEYLTVTRLSGKLTDMNGNKLSSMNVNFNINGKKYTAITDKLGEFALNYETKVVGQNNVTVSYSGNSKYNTSTIIKTFKVTSKTTKIGLFTDNYVQYSDYISINGFYEDWDQNPLISTTLTVNINGQKYYTKTNDYGYYSMDYKTNVVGTNNVTVSYPGNTKYDGTSSSTTFIVTRKDTIIVIDELYDSEPIEDGGYYHTIYGTCKDSSGIAMQYTQLSVDINGRKFSITTDYNGKYKLRYKTIGDDLITVSYAGNDKYYGSSEQYVLYTRNTAIDTNIKGIKIIDQNVNITGCVYFNDLDTRLLNINVNIDINGEKYTAKVDEEGYFNLNYKLNKIGVNNLTVSFDGNYKYISSKKTTQFIVEGIPTRLTVSNTVKQSNGEYITIKGQLYDLKGNMISYAPLTLTIDGQKYTTTTDNLGSYSYSYKGNPNNKHVLIVNYAGNAKYDKTQTQITFKAQEQENTIEILTPHTKEYYYDDNGEMHLYTENYEDISIMDAVHLGSDTISGRTQYVEGQMMAGAILMQNGIVIEIAPANTMVKAEFYFKNSDGDIKTVTSYPYYEQGNSIDTLLISGYIPYKAILTYRQKTPSEIKEWYKSNDDYYVANYY